MTPIIDLAEITEVLVAPKKAVKHYVCFARRKIDGGYQYYTSGVVTTNIAEAVQFVNDYPSETGFEDVIFSMDLPNE